MVAFTPFAGLLAWVENTVPLAEYLTGSRRTGGAHARYRRPGDYSHIECFSKMQRQPHSNDTPEKLRKSCVLFERTAADTRLPASFITFSSDQVFQCQT